VPFIGRYMTPTGQLVPRRRTRLQQKVHRHLCRQVGFGLGSRSGLAFEISIRIRIILHQDR